MKTKLHICYICAGDLGPACVCSLVWWFSLWEPLRVQVRRLLVFMWSSYSLQFTYSIPQLFHKASQAPSNVWLWVPTSVVSVSCWVEPLRGQLC